VWPDERVVRLVRENFLPVRVHVRDQADAFQRLGTRYGVQWTPATLVLAPDGTERHRVEGFLPADDFLAQLSLGLGQVAFAQSQWADAERRLSVVADDFPDSDAAPEAMYWTGVAKYKGENDKATLSDTARKLSDRFPDSVWAKKASVWLG
jgi:hypothetical protein